MLSGARFLWLAHGFFGCHKTCYYNVIKAVFVSKMEIIPYKIVSHAHDMIGGMMAHIILSAFGFATALCRNACTANVHRMHTIHSFCTRFSLLSISMKAEISSCTKKKMQQFCNNIFSSLSHWKPYILPFNQKNTHGYFDTKRNIKRIATYTAFFFLSPAASKWVRVKLVGIKCYGWKNV